MKTTVDLPDALFLAAKRRAVESRTTLRALIEDGLRHVLQEGGSRRRPRRPITWVTVPGGLPPGLDLTNRAAMQEFLRRR